MAKLVDLLAKYLVEWPDGAEYLWQNDEGFVLTDSLKVVMQKELSNDDVHISQADWLAARDRIHTETVKDMRQPTNTDTAQALWDKVAVAAVNGEMSCQSNAAKRLDAGDLVRYSFAVADAFMAERAKRLKGGV